MSAYAYHYDYPSLLVRMRDIGATDETLLRAIFKSCGDVYGETYILLYNDRESDARNPYQVLMTLLDSAFPGLEYSSADVLEELQQDSVFDVYLYDIAKKLHIELDEDE